MGIDELNLNHNMVGFRKQSDGRLDQHARRKAIAMENSMKTKPNLFVAAMEVYERVGEDLDMVWVVHNPRTHPYRAPHDTRPMGLQLTTVQQLTDSVW